MSKYTVTVELYDANSYPSINEPDWRVRVICPLGFLVHSQFSDHSGIRFNVCPLTHLYTLTADVQDEVNFLVLYLARLFLEGEDPATLSISFEVEASF